MKKIAIYALALGLAFTTSSCDDFLDEPVHGEENLDTYFSTAEEVESFVNGCYWQIAKDDWWQIYNGWLVSDMTTDDLWDGNTAQSDGYENLTHFLPTGSENGVIQNFWGARYQGIQTCNTGIERVGASEGVLTTEQKNRYMAEMRFLRAYFYFELVRNFGGVPLVTTPTLEGEGIPRASEQDIWDFIQKELDAIKDQLPRRNELSSANVGRITSGAAYGLLGKAYVYNGRFEEAKAALKELAHGTEYRLLDNFGDVWSVKYNNSEESLFEVQTMYGDNKYPLGGSLSVVTGCRNGIGDGWAWGQPTSDLENAYIAAGDHERLKWTIIKTGCTEIPGENQFQEFIENNNKVFSDGVDDAKFLTYKAAFGWDDSILTTGYIIDPSDHKSARIIRKYFLPLEDRPAVYDKTQLPLNHRILRFADVLLLYAEACNETGDDAEARWALNKVRSRVHLADVTSSGKQLRDAIRLERRLELAFEQNRLYDIRRWKGDDGQPLICGIFGPDGSFVKYNTGANADPYEKWNTRESSDKGIRFTAPRDLLWPIPTYEIQHSNGAIVQNPGW